MDLTRAIRELYAEKARLEKIISSLEQLLQGEAEPAAATGKRRGRKFMNAQARKEVSERMKKYWAERRQQEGTAAPEEQSPEPSPSAPENADHLSAREPAAVI
jgi:hypothetical protein